ncbi:MAG: EVE domain-containing protein [Gemmatimonadota bacterium]|nr:EVE domain-containing protein [Gemmatimonadota bacterium]
MSDTADRRYWLLKSEPGCFSYDDLLASPNKTTAWSGVRNYQARNFIRDDMRRGDGVLFYHSGALPGVVGAAEIVRDGYADFTAWDPANEHYDPKSSESNPIWYMVDVRAVARFGQYLDLPGLRHIRALEKMELLRKGSRLSVQPVRLSEWKSILALGGVSTQRRGRTR